MKVIKPDFSAKYSMMKIHMNLIKDTGNKIDEIRVEPKCANCSKHIEQTALLVYGVKQVKWDPGLKKLIVIYNPDKTNLINIESAIADAGHNTLNFKAKNNFYTLIPKCCQYYEQIQR